LRSAAVPSLHRADPEILRPSPSPHLGDRRRLTHGALRADDLAEFPALAMRGPPGLHGFSRFCLPPARFFLARLGSVRSRCSRGGVFGLGRPGSSRCSVSRCRLRCDRRFRWLRLLLGPLGSVSADRCRPRSRAERYQHTRFADQSGRRCCRIRDCCAQARGVGHAIFRESQGFPWAHGGRPQGRSPCFTGNISVSSGTVRLIRRKARVCVPGLALVPGQWCQADPVATTQGAKERGFDLSLQTSRVPPSLGSPPPAPRALLRPSDGMGRGYPTSFQGPQQPRWIARSSLGGYRFLRLVAEVEGLSRGSVRGPGTFPSRVGVRFEPTG
jgi:hypothetical protein